MRVLVVELHVHVFVMSCLYRSESYTRIREERFIRVIHYYGDYLCYYLNVAVSSPVVKKRKK